jgi:hypothetical protein
LLAFGFACSVGIVAFEVVAYSETTASAVAGTFVVALRASWRVIGFACSVGIVAFEVVAYSETAASAVAGTFVVALRASWRVIHPSLHSHFPHPQNKLQSCPLFSKQSLSLSVC